MVAMSCRSSERAPLPANSSRPSPPVQPSVASEPAHLPARLLTWKYDTTRVGPMQVVVSLPERRAGQRFGVLIAMHGRGEAMKGPAAGARGWVDDYGLLRAIDRLHSPPLTPLDFGRAVSPERLDAFNVLLRRHPYQGLIVVCPYTPDILAGERAFAAAEPLADFLVDELLPRVHRETPAVRGPSATAIDGVSLGGRASLLVGFGRPESFGVVAALQAAFDSAEALRVAELAAGAVERNPQLAVRLLTSEQDYFLEANRAISAALRRYHVAHVFSQVAGDHSYEFNRGPGVFEMLVFHDTALQGLSFIDRRWSPTAPTAP